jgi:argininosuccinate lyase
LVLPVVTAIIQTLQLNPDKMRAALGEELLATDLADYLVKKGLPFREAHHCVGQVVQLAAKQKLNLSQIPLADLQAISAKFAEDASEVFNFDMSVRQRKALGGTAPEAVAAQIETAKKLIGLVET